MEPDARVWLGGVAVLEGIGEGHLFKQHARLLKVACLPRRAIFVRDTVTSYVVSCRPLPATDAWWIRTPLGATGETGTALPVAEFRANEISSLLLFFSIYLVQLKSLDLEVWRICNHAIIVHILICKCVTRRMMELDHRRNALERRVFPPFFLFPYGSINHWSSSSWASRSKRQVLKQLDTLRKFLVEQSSHPRHPLLYLSRPFPPRFRWIPIG